MTVSVPSMGQINLLKIIHIGYEYLMLYYLMNLYMEWVENGQILLKMTN